MLLSPNRRFGNLLIFKKPAVYSEQPLPGGIEGSLRDWMSADLVPLEFFFSALESLLPPENI